MKRFHANKFVRTFLLLALTLALAMSLSGFAFADEAAAAAPDINQGLGLIALPPSAPSPRTPKASAKR